MKRMLRFLVFAIALTACSKNDKIDLEELPKEEVIVENPTLKQVLLHLDDTNSNYIVGQIDAENKSVNFSTLKWIEYLDALTLQYTTENGRIDELELVEDEEVEVVENIFEEELTINLVGGNCKCIIKSVEGGKDEYVINLKSPQTSGLPVMKIDADEGYDIFKNPKTKEYAPASIILIDNKDEVHNLNGERGGVRGRGNSTWPLAKKPLRIKFDEKVSLMGLPKEKSWVLLANHKDPTFLMNTVAFELAKRMELEYTNTDYHVELFHNGDYMGNYQLTEQVQVKKDRVNVDKKTGFLVELDTYFDDENKFKTDKLEMPIMIKHPEKGPFSAIEVEFNRLEDIMISQDFKDADLSSVIDLVSFAKFMLVFEITRNGEIVHPKSVKLYKKNKNEPIMAGPVWDFDWAYGHTGKKFDYFNLVDKILFKPFVGKPTRNTYFKHFLNNKQFKEVYKELWNTFYNDGKFNLNAFLDEKYEILSPSVELNQMRWKHDYSYGEKIESMKEWLNKRIVILNDEINKF